MSEGSKLTLVLGGARSGKSTFAERLAASCSNRVTYLATAQPSDSEMEERISKHRADRPAHWTTVECPYDPAAAIGRTIGQSDCYLLDCMTLLVSNLILRDEEAADTAVEQSVQEILSAHSESRAHLIVVSNEVGLGLVPEYAIGRSYRDALGRANQRLAACANSVYYLVAGIPLDLKALPTIVLPDLSPR